MLSSRVLPHPCFPILWTFLSFSLSYASPFFSFMPSPSISIWLASWTASGCLFFFSSFLHVFESSCPLPFHLLSLCSFLQPAMGRNKCHYVTTCSRTLTLCMVKPWANGETCSNHTNVKGTAEREALRAPVNPQQPGLMLWISLGSVFCSLGAGGP